VDDRPWLSDPSLLCLALNIEMIICDNLASQEVRLKLKNTTPLLPLALTFGSNLCNCAPALERVPIKSLEHAMRHTKEL
jgi:hypothetical protein